MAEMTIRRRRAFVGENPGAADARNWPDYWRDLRAHS